MEIGDPTMLRVAGKVFRCPACGSNVQTYQGNDVYRCKGCGTDYAGEDSIPAPEPKRQRIVNVVVTVVITDSDTERVETFNASRLEETTRIGRDCDVLAASRALDRCRRDIARQLDRAALSIVPPVPDSAPPCLSPQEG